MSATFDQVQQIVADVLNEDASAISAETSPKNLPSWDSLQHLNIVLALEESFGVSITPEDSDTLTSISAIVNYLESKGA